MRSNAYAQPRPSGQERVLQRAADKLPISGFGHFPMVVSHDNLRSLESIIIHEDARNLDIMEELTVPARAVVRLLIFHQSEVARFPLALAAFG